MMTAKNAVLVGYNLKIAVKCVCGGEGGQV